MHSSGLPQKFNLPWAGSAVLAGLLVTHLLSTVIVYFSNLQLHRKITAIHDAGYLAVPGLNIQPQLTSFAAAFWGALFFTLSAGAALSLVTCIAAWLYRGRSRAVFGLLLLIWLALLYLASANGWSFFAGLFFLLVPPVVFALADWNFRRQKPAPNPLLRFLPVAPLLLLAIFWLTRMDARLFENIRDHLLLTNPVGTAINDFYYRYTLYPAEVFKPISHKTLRTCVLKGIERTEFRRQLSALLRSHDYLAVDAEAAADVIVEKIDGQLALLSGRRPVMTAEWDLFSTQTERMLAEYSRRTDRFEFFRSFTFYGILVGFPVLLYMGLYGLLRLLWGLFLAPSKASMIAAACCLFAGLAAWMPIYQAGRVEITAENLQEALAGGNRLQRIAGLRFIEENALEIRNFPAYKNIIRSPHIQERYWLARALAVGRGKDSFQDLLFLLSDPHPNVVCQALYALGRRQDRAVVPEVMQTIRESDSWYIQRYGYNTIRRLGWQQRAST